MFEERVLDITEDIMLKWRLLVEERRRSGRTFSQPDVLVAMTNVGMARAHERAGGAAARRLLRGRLRR